MALISEISIICPFSAFSRNGFNSDTSSSTFMFRRFPPQWFTDMASIPPERYFAVSCVIYALWNPVAVDTFSPLFPAALSSSAYSRFSAVFSIFDKIQKNRYKLRRWSAIADRVISVTADNHPELTRYSQTICNDGARYDTNRLKQLVFDCKRHFVLIDSTCTFLEKEETDTTDNSSVSLSFFAHIALSRCRSPPIRFWQLGLDPTSEERMCHYALVKI